ncbi:uncharacterized protein DFL_005560 [Arthrobotrys flagrans]|uniref:Uncharacterized protein n=1 Tax=Arthrobotrys flagrans TaxID=97331 RepID=A0A436ZYJ7_ARTFL|nr:hypothetical protein DFL_005560 [Arthrobotrys flagrans]
MPQAHQNEVLPPANGSADFTLPVMPIKAPGTNSDDPSRGSDSEDYKPDLATLETLDYFRHLRNVDHL